MALELFRPSGLPYDGDADFGDLFAITTGTPPAFYGDGSWSDDDDATAVGFNDNAAGGESVVAVPFAAIPGAAVDADGNMMFGIRMRLTTLDGGGFAPDVLAYLVNSAGTIIAGAPRIADYTSVFSGAITSPETFDSGLWYSIFPEYEELVRTGGFTVVIGGEAGFSRDAPAEYFRVYELGLWFDTSAVTPAGRAPWLRQYPRSPLRQWPPERSYQRSNRRAGGYL